MTSVAFVLFQDTGLGFCFIYRYRNLQVYRSYDSIHLTCRTQRAGILYSAKSKNPHGREERMHAGCMHAYQ